MLKLVKHGLTKYQSSKLNSFIEKFLFYTTLIAFFVAVYEIGFLDSSTDTTILHNFYYIYLLVYFFSFSTRIPSMFQKKSKIYLTIIRILLFAFLIFYFFNVKFLFDAVDYHGLFYRLITSPNIVYVLIISIFFIEVSKSTYKVLVFNITPEILFALSFIALIFIGAGLLMLPNATVTKIKFVDALFMATSATSITGLQCIDSAVGFTSLGQGIILCLLQIGGLGVMTFTCFIVYFFKDTSSFKAGVMLGNMMSTERFGNAFKTILKIVVYTFTIEGIGGLAIFLSIRYDNSFPTLTDKITFSIYNAVSSFCNAGFSTIPGSMTSDLVFKNYPLKLIISMMAILGGVGFPILMNLQDSISKFFTNVKNAFFKHKKFVHLPRVVNVNTKLASIVSVVLLIFGTLSFFILEYNNTLKLHDGLLYKFIDSFYYSVMPRSAGFNDVGLDTFKIPTLLIIMFLMWVGASPVSTGGGIKTTTFGVAILDIFSILRGKDRIEIFCRKIANSTVRHAFAVIMISLAALGIGTFLLMIFEEKNSSANLLNLAFECTSAYCTCGLSMGITPELSDASKLLLSFLMYIGRVGALTIAAAFFKKTKSLKYMYPKEKIHIG
ncbi:MAG: ATPase [Bacteroidales bacterium]|nr:ATPase [Bacteroidales bacterium]